MGTTEKMEDELEDVRTLMVAYKLESRGYKETIEKIKEVLSLEGMVSEDQNLYFKLTKILTEIK